jgi:hypothetical protein
MSDRSLDCLRRRVRAEYLEMPDLCLTPGQAARFWATDPALTEQVLDGLASAGFLGRSRSGAYVLASVVDHAR